MTQDRRKYERVDFDCEILYPTVITDNVKKIYKDEHHLYALDISEAGICLESNFSIPLDSFLSFYFRIEDNLPFKCLVKIKWGKNQDGKFIYGGEFVALNHEDIQIMRKYISTHKQGSWL